MRAGDHAPEAADASRGGEFLGQVQVHRAGAGALTAGGAAGVLHLQPEQAYPVETSPYGSQRTDGATEGTVKGDAPGEKGDEKDRL